MRFSKLRIAWSVAWGVVAVLLVAFWIRSYGDSTSKEILVTPTCRFYLHSVQGTLALERWYRGFRGREFMPIYRKSDLLRLTTNACIYVQRSSTGTIESVSISYWLLILADIIIATAPWLRWRFSLRTLLIATTLVAAVLGLAVWAARK
jgi:hypothetical protein